MINLSIIKKVVYVLLLLFSFSCIPTKKVVYLQTEDDQEISVKPQDYEYIIQAGDRFYIDIKDPSSLLQTGDRNAKVDNDKNTRANLNFQTPSLYDYTVMEDGSIDLPIIGKIQAAGKSISDLHEFIYESCKGYINNPSIKVFMTNYNVSVLGELNQPGWYQLIQYQPTLFDAIAMGSDLTDFADRKRVKIIRKVKGELTVAYVDITDPNFINSPYFYLQPNDVIHVMPLKVKKFSSDNAFPMILSVITAIITVLTITRTN